MAAYQTVILASWIVFILVWAISAFNVKRDIRGGFSSVWKYYAILRLVAVAILVFLAIRVGTGAARFTDSSAIAGHGVFASIAVPPLFLGWIGALLSVVGVAFAIWARISLGRNWSSRPSVKENHELVTTGPYAYVRHPIYSGLLATAFGSVLTGTVFGVIVFGIACAIFSSRIKKEEQIMLELFPDAYPGYKKRTWALIPFVW